MQKLIWGCMVMLCGIIGGTGWLIARASIVEPGAWSTLLNLFPIVGHGGLDGCIIIVFYVIAILGAIVAIRALKDQDKK